MGPGRAGKEGLGRARYPQLCKANRGRIFSWTAPQLLPSAMHEQPDDHHATEVSTSTTTTGTSSMQYRPLAAARAVVLTLTPVRVVTKYYTCTACPL